MTIALAAAAAAHPAAPPRLVYCHMMECSWERRISNAVVRTTPNGQLRKYVIAVGASTHRNGRYPRTYSRAVRIVWRAKPNSDYVFCSRSRPALAFQDEQGKWIAHAMDLFNLAGYNTASAVIYARACHGLDFNAADIETKLRRLGYRPGTRSRQIDIGSPLQLVDLPPDPRR